MINQSHQIRRFRVDSARCCHGVSVAVVMSSSKVETSRYGAIRFLAHYGKNQLLSQPENSSSVSVYCSGRPFSTVLLGTEGLGSQRRQAKQGAPFNARVLCPACQGSRDSSTVEQITPSLAVSLYSRHPPHDSVATPQAQITESRPTW